MKKAPKTIPITMRFQESWIKKLKTTARHQAYINDTEISYHKLIKEAVYEKYIK